MAGLLDYQTANASAAVSADAAIPQHLSKQLPQGVQQLPLVGHSFIQRVLPHEQQQAAYSRRQPEAALVQLRGCPQQLGRLLPLLLPLLPLLLLLHCAGHPRRAV